MTSQEQEKLLAENAVLRKQIEVNNNPWVVSSDSNFWEEVGEYYEVETPELKYNKKRAKQFSDFLAVCKNVGYIEVGQNLVRPICEKDFKESFGDNVEDMGNGVYKFKK